MLLIHAVRISTSLALVALIASACDDDPTAPPANEQELITEVTLTLTPAGGGTAITTTIADPDGAGPNPPEAQTEDIVLTPGTTYDGTVEFWDRSNPSAPENITEEVEEEADLHRVFYLLSGLSGVTVPDDSLDEDDNGAPLGISFQVVVDAAASGTGTIEVILSHYDEEPKGDGSEPSEETDVDVTFDASVS
jgi:hypothetical protein